MYFTQFFIHIEMFYFIQIYIEKYHFLLHLFH